MRRLLPVLALLLLLALLAAGPCSKESAPPPAPPDRGAGEAPGLDDVEPGDLPDPEEGPAPEAGAEAGGFVILSEDELTDVDFDDNCWVSFSGDDVTLVPELEGAAVFVNLRPLGLTKGSFGMSLDANTLIQTTAADGAYEVEVSAAKDGVLVRAKTTLTVVDGSGQMPPVKLEPRAGVRARVLDAAGEQVPQARIVVVRPEEEPPRAHQVDPGPEGWIAYRDLEPGVYHRVVVLGVPERVEQTVLVPPEPKGVAEVEIRLDARVVPVRLRYELEASRIQVPAEKVRARLAETGFEWESAHELGSALLPGTYEFRITECEGRLVVRPDSETDGFVALALKDE